MAKLPKWIELVFNVRVCHRQGGHKPGKPGILRDFPTWMTHGILREFCATSEKTDFALWVQPVSSSPYAAKCIWCMKTVGLSSTERQPVLGHIRSS